MAFGFIYVLVNDSLPYLKVGKTQRSPEQRAAELSSTGVPTPYKVAYSRYVENCDQLELQIHRKLSSKRVSHNREFFTESLTNVVELIESMASPLQESDELPQDWNPLDYIKDLAYSRKEEEERCIDEETLYRNIALKYRDRLFSILEPVNGSIISDGLEVHFEAYNEHDEFGIYIYYRLPELPIFATLHYMDARISYEMLRWSEEDWFCIHIFGESKYEDGMIGLDDENDLPDINVMAKSVLDRFEWATASEVAQRRNRLMPIPELLEKTWIKYENENNSRPAPSPKHELIIDFHELSWPSEYANQAATEIASQFNIPDITVRSWKKAYLDEDIPEEVVTKLNSWLQEQWSPNP
ncbi:DNA polymerase elongation subunit [Thiohalobacter thiocyanaticus]|uniref:DNA polymerase elongation subunit n=1 Tax=Thiohalobacter thiocyanaticus TaxID=585455 RepID=A0A1Z4VQL2_9GAMM|nr:GIY-YIG nuclease family protein [Thiohalobacter thiocyanaticus]BAZ93775.1 DNA polymerase elongation subunit [Thiohalobacter thiocyanaticus]